MAAATDNLPRDNPVVCASLWLTRVICSQIGKSKNRAGLD